jgi:peptidoglycan/xylan/chitin deacetylase (PgdA/CDA1 family)
MTAVIQDIVRATDALLARAYLSVFQERDALLCFLFHSLFRDQREMGLNLIDPLERTTVAHFRQLVGYYLANGYRFVTPAEVLAVLPPDGRYAMLTFDDGYFNNLLALPVLEEFRVPAIFFISTNHVLQNKCFWWDVLYRERKAQGASRRRIVHEALALKSLRTDRIEAQLLERFGPNALTPRGDVDRPFSPAELRQFASSPYVHLGNHTADHAILPNYSPPEIRQQVAGAQQSLREITGVDPIAIAYPNGAHNQQVTRTCRELGLRLGFTIRPQKTSLPIAADSPKLMTLGRFVPRGRSRMSAQCHTYRSDLQLYGTFRAGYLWLRRGQIGQ